MHNIIKKIDRISAKSSIVYLLKDLKEISGINLTDEDKKIIKTQKSQLEKAIISINKAGYILVFYIPKEINEGNLFTEDCRIAGDKVQGLVNEQQIEKVIIKEGNYSNEETLAFIEGMALGNYQFMKYKKSKNKEGANALKEIDVLSKKITEKEIGELNIIVNSVYQCRDLVNEPVSYLNATKLSEEISKMGKDSGFKVEVLNKKRIESLKMGGLLAVNKGSADPPTFSILEWKPAKSINKKPYVLVGKGVVFDTGGMNLKPGIHMADMKCDMAGAAVVATTMYAIARAKLPVHVIGLVPSTDNRLNGNAYVPGDVVTMYEGITVEVLNTDAEGRMILADALSYAKKYSPELVIDLATLTGAAAIAIGKYGIVGMNSKAEEEFKALSNSGEKVYERLVEFPFWEEYGELIKSEVADIKNVGGRDAGAITAGKFLEKFTDYPWIHLDIAGPAYVDKRYNYRGSAATGIGVRLLFDFMKNKSKKS